MDLSNKTLALLLVAAMVISIGGTFLSLQKLGQVQTPTGYATNNQTGDVTIAVSSELSVVVNDSTIDFGSCSINTTQGFSYLMSAGAQGTEDNSDCDNTLGFPDWLEIRNDGNKDGNLTMRTQYNKSGFFVTDPTGLSFLKFNVTNISATIGCDGSVFANNVLDSNQTMDKGIGGNYSYTICSNLSVASPNNGVFFYMIANLSAGATTIPGGVNQLTFELKTII